MTKVINFADRSEVDIHAGIDPDEVLRHALGQLEDVVLVGTDKEGDIYFAASHDRLAEINLVLDWVKAFIIKSRMPYIP